MVSVLGFFIFRFVGQKSDRKLYFLIYFPSRDFKIIIFLPKYNNIFFPIWVFRVYGRHEKGRLRQTKKRTFTADRKMDVYGRHEKGRLRQTRERTFMADKKRTIAADKKTNVYGREE